MSASVPPTADWFEAPLDGGVWLDVCKESGMLRSQECPDYERVLLPAQAQESAVCPYHKDGTFRLPPAMEWYYKAYHPEYEVRPATRDIALMEFLYPEPGTILTLPRQMDSSEGGAVFQAVHRDPAATLYWHLDDTYLGETRIIHQMRLSPAPGKHTVTVVDGDGNSVSVHFTISGSI